MLCQHWCYSVHVRLDECHTLKSSGDDLHSHHLQQEMNYTQYTVSMTMVNWTERPVAAMKCSLIQASLVKQFCNGQITINTLRCPLVMVLVHVLVPQKREEGGCQDVRHLEVWQIVEFDIFVRPGGGCHDDELNKDI